MVTKEQFFQKRYPDKYKKALQLYEILPREGGIKNRLESIDFNFDFFQKKHKELQFPDFKNSDYYIKKDFNSQTDKEAPFKYSIINRRTDKKIASFNFFFEIKNQTKNLRINHIKGLKGSKKDIDKLNRVLSKEWSVYILDKLINFSKINNYNVIGQLPRRFNSTLKDYRRYLENYVKSYVNAGLSIKNIDYSKIEYKNIKSFIKINELINKLKPKLEIQKQGKTKINELQKAAIEIFQRENPIEADKFWKERAQSILSREESNFSKRSKSKEFNSILDTFEKQEEKDQKKKNKPKNPKRGPRK